MHHSNLRLQITGVVISLSDLLRYIYYMNRSSLFAGIILCIGAILFQSFSDDWGFFGHRRINRLAVFTLPAECIGFFKSNIDYISEHAVDPDKRRYATKHEAVRHYIDLDHWGAAPFEAVPRKWIDVMALYSQIQGIDQNGDTTLLFLPEVDMFKNKTVKAATGNEVDLKTYKEFIYREVLPSYYEDERPVDLEKMKAFFPDHSFNYESAFVEEEFSSYGILPYHLLQMQKRLTKAFEQKNVKSILRLSAEMGHYVGDGHVPLHTTENYNGQLTDQIGIHGFWESRIPELFADSEYDYFVGQAEYIEDPENYFWDVILTSHSYVDSVLQIERRLKETFPKDAQMCYDDRLDRTVQVQCRAFAKAYQDAMNGMVEKRMQASIKSIGSCWYTAWVDAGQPKLDYDLDIEVADEDEEAKLEEAFRRNSIFGRTH